MKILLLSAYFPPEVGSAAHLFADIGAEFVKRGHNVTVLTGYPTYNVDIEKLPAKYKSGWFLRENYRGIDVLRTRPLGMPRNILFLRGLDQLLSSFFFVLSGVFKYRETPDVVLVYSPPIFLGLAGLILRSFKKTKIILNIQDLFPQQAIDLGLIRNVVVIKFFRALEQYLYRHVDVVTVHSPGNKEYITRRGRNPKITFVAPNVVDTESIQPGNKHNAFRNRWEIKSSEFVVSFAGVLGYNQDLDSVIEAGQLLRETSDIIFLIVGDGVEKSRLLEKAKGMHNVRFLPMLSKEEYVELLHASDACLVTLHKTVKTPVVPSKILSIMAAGRPIIAALPLDGDAPAIIKEADCGICVEPENARQLADAVSLIRRQENLAIKYGANGRKQVEKHFSLTVSASLYEDLFKMLSGKN